MALNPVFSFCMLVQAVNRTDAFLDCIIFKSGIHVTDLTEFVVLDQFC